MLGILVQLFVSWIVIWFFEKGSLRILGFRPTKKRLRQFAFFFLLTAFCSASGYVMRMFFLKQQWNWNPELSGPLLLSGIWWNLKSVLFEELIFRGVLLYILIKILGQLKGIIISAVAFGIYHWFSQEVLGNPVQMTYVFLITGAMGLVYAYGYAKTYSLYVPIAMHLGWNLVGSVIFSETSISNQLLVLVKPVPDVEIGYLLYFSIQLIPLAAAICLNLVFLRRMRQATYSPSTISP